MHFDGIIYHHTQVIEHITETVYYWVRGGAHLIIQFKIGLFEAGIKHGKVHSTLGVWLHPTCSGWSFLVVVLVSSCYPMFFLMLFTCLSSLPEAWSSTVLLHGRFPGFFGLFLQ